MSRVLTISLCLVKERAELEVYHKIVCRATIGLFTMRSHFLITPSVVYAYKLFYGKNLAGLPGRLLSYCCCQVR